MSSVPFHYVDLRAFCYATEDSTRVETALRTLMPEEAELEGVESEGHHGDRILVLSARLERADEIRHVLSKLATLQERQRETLLAELDDRIDDNTSFFLTLSKQAAFNGDIERGDGITLRGKVEAYPATRDRAIEHVRDALETL
ncbi:MULTISPECIES: RNA-binding protein [unclassified Halorhabdus]|uniref:RNA-binding protein n=1 Tax=unclassified Halorhabdus TaxID=2621901 RepID=UPI0023DC0B2D|nr:MULTISPECIES: RNA-binding protein [unclassified Halorhabdus]WEL17246.1 RNA-binding protein [Halorhabdus sp. SVX81]WEL21129.1 RNA-binding protein [Halorhabdus sp. BNX81]